jgi:hypothetical protein
MSKDEGKKYLDEVRNVELALAARLEAMSDAELEAELAESGLDLDAESARVEALLKRTAGKARMKVAKLGAAGHATSPRHLGRALPSPANDIRAAKGMTMAARHGTEQSEADLQSLADDLAELEAMEKESPKE